MTDKERVMELYLQYGEREFIWSPGLSMALLDNGWLWNGSGLRTKITPDGLRLVGKET